MRARACVWRVTELTEFTWAESSGVVELVRSPTPDLHNVGDGVDGNARCEMGGPYKHAYTCSTCLHAIVHVYVCELCSLHTKCDINACPCSVLNVVK